MLIFALMLLGSPFAAVAQIATPAPAYDPAELVAIKPELRADVAAALPAGMTEYAIELTYSSSNDGAGFTMNGQVRAGITNTTGEPLSALPFRLYANSPAQPETMTIQSLRVEDTESTWEFSVDNSVATVPLLQPLAPGEQVQVAIAFTFTVPVNDQSRYGIFNHSSANDTTVMAHWYPVLAGRDPATGWMLKPVSQFGDPVFTDAAMYDVTIFSPGETTFITSGVETSRQLHNDGWVEITYSAKPSRDFVIIQSGQLQSVMSEHAGTTITSWHMPNHQPAGEAVAGWTADSLSVFNPLLGDYPWVQLQVVEANVYGAAAVELPQMFIMGSSFYGTANLDERPGFFEFTVAHEAVHMWFYSLVGNNQYDDALIDEGLTNYLSGDVYFRQLYGDDIGDIAHQQFLYAPFLRMIDSNADVIVDFPTDDFPNGGSYSAAVYTKAPLGFHAIHQAMGDDPFFAGLRDYVAEFRFRVASPSDLETALQARTEIDVREIWSHWFERREGGLDIRGVQHACIA